MHSAFALQQFFENLNKMKLVFIVNPISGTKSKQRILDLIPQYFDGSEYEYEIKHTERAGHAEELAQEAARVLWWLWPWVAMAP